GRMQIRGTAVGEVGPVPEFVYGPGDDSGPGTAFLALDGARSARATQHRPAAERRARRTPRERDRDYPLPPPDATTKPSESVRVSCPRSVAQVSRPVSAAQVWRPVPREETPARISLPTWEQLT